MEPPSLIGLGVTPRGLRSPKGVRLNNPGNLMQGGAPFHGEKPPTDKREREFYTMALGVRALALTLKTYIKVHGCNTVRKIVTRYAPPVENNTPAYIDAVCRYTGFEPDQKLGWDIKTVELLTRAIIHQEEGGDLVSITDLSVGVESAYNA